MTKEELLEKLEYYTNPNFSFNEKYHRYTYKSENFISVTTFLQKFHKPFDYNYWVKKKAEDEGITVEEKKAEWKYLNDRANEIGSATHNWIENYYNGIVQELPVDMDVIDRINKFNIIYAEKLYKLTPIKFEQKLFSEQLKIAGMIDSLFLYNGKVVIVDWKTNKEFTTDEHKKGRYEDLLHPFDSYYKNHHNEYSIQISLYAYILGEIGIDVKGMYLCYIGPDKEDENGNIIKRPAELHRVKDMRPELDLYFKNDIFSL
ncbi:MAG: putative exonuclease [uncultured marine phage]|uniref:Putative exonuclease n=1 Tax=uncultured marine phage TaxID=707152 RepID=A0A8D9FQ97_9VIRU|nr:MAG: putative exonuclease [uncultured marine phage]